MDEKKMQMILGQTVEQFSEANGFMMLTVKDGYAGLQVLRGMELALALGTEIIEDGV